MHKIINYCNKKIIFLSNYDISSVDLLERVGVPAYKIASTDNNNLPPSSILLKRKTYVYIHCNGEYGRN